MAKPVAASQPRCKIQSYLAARQSTFGTKVHVAYQSSSGLDECQMKAAFAYATNDLIDTDHAVIVAVEATPARWSAEVAATKTMLARTQESFESTPQALAADAARLFP